MTKKEDHRRGNQCQTTVGTRLMIVLGKWGLVIENINEAINNLSTDDHDAVIMSYQLGSMKNELMIRKRDLEMGFDGCDDIYLGRAEL